MAKKLLNVVYTGPNSSTIARSFSDLDGGTFFQVGSATYRKMPDEVIVGGRRYNAISQQDGSLVDIASNERCYKRTALLIITQGEEI